MAACAWPAAALFRPGTAQPKVETPPPEEALRLRGVVLRREIALGPFDAPASAVDGRRLSAVETGSVSGLYFETGEGCPAPEEALPFTRARTEALLEGGAGEPAGPRLVTGNAVWVAALVEGGAAPASGRVRVCFDGAAGAYEALIEAADENALLLRVTEGLDFLGRARFVEGTIEK